MPYSVFFLISILWAKITKALLPIQYYCCIFINNIYYHGCMLIYFGNLYIYCGQWSFFFMVGIQNHQNISISMGVDNTKNTFRNKEDVLIYHKPPEVQKNVDNDVLRLI